MMQPELNTFVFDSFSLLSGYVECNWAEKFHSQWLAVIFKPSLSITKLLIELFRVPVGWFTQDIPIEHELMRAWGEYLGNL